MGRGGTFAACALACLFGTRVARAAPMDAERVAQDVGVAGAEAAGVRPRSAGPRDGIEVAHVHLDATTSSDAEGEALARGSRATITTQLVRVVVPTLVEKDVALFGGLTYEAATIDVEGTRAATLRPLIEMKATLGIDARFAEVWHLTALVAPGSFGDAGKADDSGAFGEEDAQLAAGIVVDRRFGEELTLGAGLAYSTTFDLPVPLPSISVGFEHDRWLAVDLVLPSYGEVAVMPHERIAIGLRGGIETSTWNVDTPPAAMVAPFGAAPPQNLTLDARVVTIGPTFSARLVGPLVFDLRLAGAFARKLELTDRQDGDRSTRIDLAPCANVRAGLGVRL